jgi:hypothetical protein
LVPQPECSSLFFFLSFFAMAFWGFLNRVTGHGTTALMEMDPSRNIVCLGHQASRMSSWHLCFTLWGHGFISLLGYYVYWLAILVAVQACPFKCQVKKGKAIPLHAWTGPEGG